MSYVVENLGFVPTFASASRAYAVSNYGVFMGFSSSNTTSVGFTGTQNNLSSIVPLLPTQTTSGIYASNKSGTIFGGFISNAGKNYPFLSVNGSIQDVTVTTDAHSQVLTAISPSGNSWSIVANGGISSIGYGVPIPGAGSTQSYFGFKTGLTITYNALTPDAGLPAGSFMYLAANSDNGFVAGSSNNGLINSTFKANLWNYSNPSPIRLSPFAGDNAALATSISADGSIVAGFSFNSTLLDYKPVIWTNTVVASIGLPTGYISGWITNMSADGRFYTGGVSDGLGKTRAFVYDLTRGFVVLDPLTNTSAPLSQANAYFISNDGRYVAGIAETDTIQINATGWVGSKLYDRVPLSVPQPIAMPCFENCLGKNSALTKLY